MKLQITIDTMADEEERENDATILQSLAAFLLTGVAAVSVPAVNNVVQMTPSDKALEAVAAAAVAAAKQADEDDADDGAEFDKAGFPWDERIHSSGKTKVQKTGLWTLKRGVDAALVKQVQDEFMNRPAAVQVMPAEAGVPVPPETPSVPAPPPPAPAAPQPEQPAAVPAPPAPATAPVPEAPAASGAGFADAAEVPDDKVFSTCVATMNELQQAGRIPAGFMEGLYAENGVTGLSQLATKRVAARAILNTLLQL